MMPKVLMRRLQGCLNCPFAIGGLVCSKRATKIDFLDAGFCPVGQWAKVYIMGLSTIFWDAAGKSLWIEREDRVIEKKLDSAFKRNGHLCWAAEDGSLADEEREMQVRFDQKTRTLWLPKANQALENKLDAKYERIGSSLRWVVPEDGFTIDRAVDMVSAKVSGSLEPSDPIIAQRMASCTGCDALKRDANGAWCVPCGCGGKNLMINADGTPAAKMLHRRLNCPKFMAGFTNAVG